MAGKQDETNDMFEKRIFATVQSGFTAVSVAVGSSLGLFNTMARIGEAVTSHEIADAAGLKERYVREWLGAMVVAGIVDVDSDKNTYYLPPHRHNTLCTKDGDGLASIYCQAIPLLCEAYEDLINCFQKDGPKGIPDSAYTAFDTWIDASSSLRLKGKSPACLTNNQATRKILETTSTVCDVGCGRGAALCFLARDFPKSKFHGIEVSEEAVAAAKSRAARMQLSNVTFHLGDAIKMAELEAWESKFDLVVCVDVVHDVGRPDLLLKGIGYMMKNGGCFVMSDVGLRSRLADNSDNPWSPIVYTISLIRCMPISLASGDDSFGLGSTWGKERALQMLNESGFECYQTGKTDAVNLDFYCKKNV